MPRKIIHPKKTRHLHINEEGGIIGLEHIGRFYKEEIERIGPNAKTDDEVKEAGGLDYFEDSVECVDYFHKKPFIKVSREALLLIAFKDLLTISESRVLLFIISKASFNNAFIYHNKDIAYALNLSFSTVSRAFKKLLKLGYMDKSVEFTGFQICTQLCWKGKKYICSVQGAFEQQCDIVENKRKYEAGEIDGFGREIPQEERDRKR